MSKVLIRDSIMMLVYACCVPRLGTERREGLKQQTAGSSMPVLSQIIQTPSYLCTGIIPVSTLQGYVNVWYPLRRSTSRSRELPTILSLKLNKPPAQFAQDATKNNMYEASPPGPAIARLQTILPTTADSHRRAKAWRRTSDGEEGGQGAAR